MITEGIEASRCPRCRRIVVPPARMCPDHPVAMEPHPVPAVGEVVSFTTLHSPPAGFASPLHMALVALDGGANFFCHGSATRGLKIGARVSIEAVDQVYYFATLSLAERANLFWRRGGARTTERLASFARSAAKRLRWWAE